MIRIQKIVNPSFRCHCLPGVRKAFVFELHVRKVRATVEARGTRPPVLRAKRRFVHQGLCMANDSRRRRGGEAARQTETGTTAPACSDEFLL
jgi:hypothetical protein